MKTKIEACWPDYDTSFTFRVKCNDKTIWSDENKMPQSLRLLLSSAINTLDHNSTLGETVLEHMDAEVLS